MYGMAITFVVVSLLFHTFESLLFSQEVHLSKFAKQLKQFAFLKLQEVIHSKKLSKASDSFIFV